MFSAFTRHRISSHTHPGYSSWLLQWYPSRRTESNDGQVATSVKCRSSGGQRYKQVWPWLVTAPAHRATLARCTWASCIQAECHDVQLHARPSSTVPDGFLPSDLQRRMTATTSICQLTTPSRSTLPAKRGSFSVVVPSVWNSLPDYLRDSGVGRDTFRHLRTFMFFTNAYSALDVLRLCAIEIYIDISACLLYIYEQMLNSM